MTGELDAAVESVKAGDREAFRVVVRETAALVRGYIGFFLSDKAAVDDVSQAVYLEIFKQIGRYERGTDFAAWVKAIARNHALAERRRRERKDQAHSNYVSQIRSILEAKALEIEERQPIQEQISRLEQCLAKLPERMQSVVKLHYHEDYTAGRIAQTLKSTTGAVLNILYRARMALSRCVKAEGVAP
ncbi:MAG TPA: sigma-70 family RNA polymerase sigma factor [Planctomycetota bacterium]|nr:sigma-70 family RNA polymerase sigma factor [Planctomycetota bacterium]